MTASIQFEDICVILLKGITCIKYLVKSDMCINIGRNLKKIFIFYFLIICLAIFIILVFMNHKSMKWMLYKLFIITDQDPT